MPDVVWARSWWCRATWIRRWSWQEETAWPAPTSYSPTMFRRRATTPRPHLQPRPRSAAQHRSRRASAVVDRVREQPRDERERTAVVLMAYGTPRTPDEILPYYTDIRRGHPPTDEQLAELTARYAAIGGISPLASRTEAQREAPADGTRSRRRPAATRRARPQARDTVHRDNPSTSWPPKGSGASSDWCWRPHYSAFSIGQYLDRLTAAAAAHDIAVHGIESWATEPAFVDFIAADLRATLADTARPRHGAVHGPLASRTDPRRRRPISLPTASDRRVRSCCSGSRTGGWPGRAPGAHPNRGWAPTSCTSSTSWPPTAAPRRVGQRRRFRQRSPRSAVRPRHRGADGPHAARPGLCPHGMRQRRRRGDGRALPTE